ncbi:Photosynthetic apparatus regulatory protein RegA [Thiomonas arsenitoxydans]|uniref:Photosynthetic apparatus regulatory protein RegA n=1 Tax=Thiomonas arsenitoxydans (strain DSM 22701 / CIP 110005 / 3As) TaxID=426114 RepID=D6CKV9_THIA3|nr:response regulator [Thiomonas arsenitoxydans]CAZ87577.1 response regulators of two-component regulatory system [Thiomonas arsenitoxydans]CQR27045.1 Photosynthetic apparatus regulatory protein RegA [Thiomonas arsenitoxydans]CQR30030.1 Photosynthetic apparatus regulatory protein RegA [Thiomonas arsenitoxydans]CQR30081.1 Photosynthetic apparatus regulatory protein RegA [Thiomonas arsenitoxydans]CQR32525.1 Photosynthetic apparatus regulatory protein RegA [Thiomonas arsenitoxydans]
MNGKPMNLLLVEDDAALAAATRNSMERRGISVWHADSAPAARALIGTAAFDAAVLDLRLPGDSGLTLIAPLRAVYPDLRILLLTGYASIATAVDAIKLGATNYLPKPATVSDILAALEQDEPEADRAVAAQPLPVDRLEWEHIQKVLAEHDGNISATARALQMHRRTLQRKLLKHPVREAPTDAEPR